MLLKNCVKSVSDTPAQYGGIGADFSFCAVSAEEQGYAGPDFFGPGFGLHTRLVRSAKFLLAYSFSVLWHLICLITEQKNRNTNICRQ